MSPAMYASPLRRELVDGEPSIVEGAIPLPVGPGLGVELSEAALRKYQVA
jgi:L-alanine-DL-glutamate epimerase-like enolase superfamily enzyme